MNVQEAIAQYIVVKKNYAELCLLCESDRINNREERHNAYIALMHAETDIIDIAIEQVEEKTNTNLSEELRQILSSSELRYKFAEMAILMLNKSNNNCDVSKNNCSVSNLFKYKCYQFSGNNCTSKIILDMGVFCKNSVDQCGYKYLNKSNFDLLKCDCGRSMKLITKGTIENWKYVCECGKTKFLQGE